jgi:arginine utilization protein RocB
MSNILDIVKGINQAAANAFDGAITEEGEPLDIGLQRDKPTPITDRRVMDGFGVTFNGTTMRVNYHREVATNEVMSNKLKADVETAIAEVSSFLKKEYKNVTGETLRLKKLPGDVIGNVQSTSRARSWVQAHCDYEIQGVEGHDVKDKNDIDASIRSFLDLGKNAKKPQNVSITPKANEK